MREAQRYSTDSPLSLSLSLLVYVGLAAGQAQAVTSTEFAPIQP